MTESLLIPPLFLNSGGFHEQGPVTFDAHPAEHRLTWAPKRRPIMHSLSFNHALASFMAFGYYSEKPETQHTWSKNPVTLEKDPLPRGRRFRPWPNLPAAGPRPTRWNPQLCRKQWREWQARTPRPCLGLINKQSRTWSSEGGAPLWRDCIRRYLIRLMSVDRRFGSNAQNHFSLMATAVHDVQRTPLKTNHAHVWSDRHYQPMKLWFPPHARGPMLT